MMKFVGFTGCLLALAATTFAAPCQIKAKTLPKLVDFGAEACIPCKKLAPILKQLTQEYKGVLTVEFIDVWQKKNVPKAQAHKIKVIPTQIFFTPCGKELWRHEGFITKEAILAKWKELGYNLKPSVTITEKRAVQKEASAPVPTPAPTCGPRRSTSGRCCGK